MLNQNKLNASPISSHTVCWKLSYAMNQSMNTSELLWFESAKSQISEFIDYRISKFPNREFRHFGLSEFQTFRLSRFQNFKLAKFQNRVAELRNFRFSTSRNFRLSEFRYFRMINLRFLLDLFLFIVQTVSCFHSSAMNIMIMINANF